MTRLGIVRSGLIAAALCLSGALSIAGGNDWTGLGLFAGPNAKTGWVAPDGSVIKAVPGLYGDDAGLQMKVTFKKDTDRVYRDVPVSLDLSSYTEFSLAIRITNPSAVSRCSLYFKSGSGWFGGWFSVSGSEWQTIILSRSAFSPEGTPVGWNAISGVRLAVWKAEPRPTRVDIAALRGRSSPISILRNSAGIKKMPAEETVINRAADRLRLWFEAYRLHASVIDDEELAANGAPPGCRMMILPYNPELPATTQAALERFTLRGGKLIVMYALTPEMAPLLGLTGKQWMAAAPPDIFSAIRLNTGSADGLPPSVRQDSWNANIPQPKTATVLGTWQNAAGVDSGLPAITLGGSGIFIGHLLTNVDREQKMTLLLALTAKLLPDLTPMLSRQMYDQAEQLFEFENWAQTSAFIETTASRNGQTVRLARRLKDIETLREKNAGAVNTDPFGTAVTRAGELRHLIRQTYFESVKPKTPSTTLRGAWCHNAAGPAGQDWASAVSQLKRSGFNTLFANHQWAGVAYYPSEILPVSRLVTTQGDLLQQCLDACRKEGISLHLWSVLWVLDNAPDECVADMEKSGRLIKDRNGKTVRWLCPANPLNIDLAVNAAVEVVRKYAVDGFHLDYIRYPDGDSCYCTNCATRFRKATGRASARWPQDVISGADHAAFTAWRRDQITVTVSRIRQALKAVRPSIQVSAAVWGNWPGVRDSIGQDWAAWCRNGLLDFVCPMNYVPSAAEAVKLFTGQLSAIPRGFPIYPGISPTSCNLPPEETVRQVDALREAGAKGFVLFELDHDLLSSHLPALRAGATSR